MMQRCSKLSKTNNHGVTKRGNNSHPPPPPSQWSQLPQELLSKICSILEAESPAEKCRFLQVCKTWYSCCFPCSKHVLYDNLPLKIPKIFPDCIQAKNPFFLVGTSVFLVQPFEGPFTVPWLVSLEEFTLGKVRVHCPLTKKPIVDMPLGFPKGLNLSGFRVGVVHEGLKICFEDGSEDDVVKCENDRFFGPLGRTKVILATKDGDLCDGRCVAVVLMIGGYYSLASFNISVGGWRRVDEARFSRFDDIVCLEGLVHAIDRKGRVYEIDVENNVVKVGDEVTSGVCEGISSATRKRLLVLDEELCMINLADNCKKFEVYKLNEEVGNWDEVKSLGDKILFVTMDDVFWIDAREVVKCRGNCILFSKQCFFENQVFHGAKEYLEVGVYYLGEDCSLPVSAYPEFCDLLWPFPSWICSNSQGVSSSPKELKERQSNSSRFTTSRFNTMESSPVVAIPAGPPQMVIALKAQSSPEDTARKVSGTAHQNNNDAVQNLQIVKHLPEIHVDGSSPKIGNTCGHVPPKPVAEIIDLDSIPDANASPNESTKYVATLEKFEGVNVSSQFVPYLQNVRSKHGNIIQGNVDEVQSNSLLLRCGLETLAQMVKILESQSVRSLSDSDAKLLDAFLLDLRFIRFNVEVIDWLVPLVKSALDHHRANIERTRRVQELENARSEMLAVLRKVEETLARERKMAAENLSAV